MPRSHDEDKRDTDWTKQHRSHQAREPQGKGGEKACGVARPCRARACSAETLRQTTQTAMPRELRTKETAAHALTLDREAELPSKERQ